jgi:hypothetical protein
MAPRTPGEGEGEVEVEGEDAAEFHRDRREHGGAAQRLNDDQLAELTEEERVDAGLDAFNPDEVPPATDTPPQSTDIRETEVYEEERAELRRQIDDGEFRDVSEREPFPPTRYED